MENVKDNETIVYDLTNPLPQGDKVGLADELITEKLKNHPDFKVVPPKPKYYDTPRGGWKIENEAWANTHRPTQNHNSKLRKTIWREYMSQ
tara:strand:+ start:204 stop:476 length:273 start_codon:yes stop_codon:yes gene_type:complete